MMFEPVQSVQPFRSLRSLGSFRRLRMVPSTLWPIRAATLGFAIAAIGAVPLAAQNTAAISGIVRDDAGKPIPSVEIRAVKQDRVVRSDTGGHFILTGLPSGGIDLSFRRLSYEPATV